MFTVKTPSTLFETSVVGSLPRPQWVRDLMVAGESGRLPADTYRELCDKATVFAIGLQELAGVDVVTDGEWRRLGYVEILAQRVTGFEPIDVGEGHFRVTGRLRRERPILLDSVQFLREHTTHRTKVTIPSPYHLSNHSKFDVSPALYSRESFLSDLVDVVAQEVTELSRSGVDVIQLDDPRFVYVTMSELPRNLFTRGRGDLKSEMKLAVESLNKVFSCAGDARTALHLCHGNTERRTDASGGYGTLMPYLHELTCDQVLMEFSIPAAGELGVLRDFPAAKLLGLGAVDVRGVDIDTPSQIIGRAEAAMEYIRAERITLNPDCGFAPFMANNIGIDESYQKLRAQAEAAEKLRRRHGSSRVLR